MHKYIVFNQSDHEPPCCSNTESQHGRVTGSVKWRVMTPVQRGGLAAMTLKRGTSHSAPVKCLRKKKKLSLLHHSLLDKWPPPPTRSLLAPLPHLPFQYTAAPSVHVTSLFSAHSSLWRKTHNTSPQQQHHALYYGKWTSWFQSTYIRK